MSMLWTRRFGSHGNPFLGRYTVQRPQAVLDLYRVAAVRKIAVVPTLFTLGNAVCGFGAVVLASQTNMGIGISFDTSMYAAGWLIVAAMLFDVFDGYLARRTKSASQFGAELDSLCDAVSFGVAPALLLLQMCRDLRPALVQQVIFLIGILYLCCVVLRLARFNVETGLDAKSHRYFRGLPSPAAAGCVAALVTLRYKPGDLPFASDPWLNNLIPWIALFGTFAVALLMVSRVPYVHFSNRVLHRRHNFTRLIQFLLGVFAIVLLQSVFREMALVGVFWIYTLAGPAHLIWNRSGAAVTATRLDAGKASEAVKDESDSPLLGGADISGSPTKR
jgi:CDP-diacylglycerol--serine O-phosphatidyltransferase